MSRESILARIKANKPELVNAPPSFEKGIIYDDKLASFKDSLASVKAEVGVYENEAEFIKKFPEIFKDSSKVYSQVKELNSFEASEPKEYEVLDVAVYRARLGVAENAAIFVNFQDEKVRSQATLAQSLCLIVKEEDVYDNMHQAYAEIAKGKFPDYGVFISGPSKTADIEQCLVIGAHGACALKVAIIKAGK